MPYIPREIIFLTKFKILHFLSIRKSFGKPRTISRHYQLGLLCRLRRKVSPDLIFHFEAIAIYWVGVSKHKPSTIFMKCKRYMYVHCIYEYRNMFCKWYYVEADYTNTLQMDLQVSPHWCVVVNITLRVFFFGNNEFPFQSECKENHSPDVTRELTDKTGDGKFPLCLPTTPGNVQDLHTITPQILSDLLQGAYKDTVQSFRIIDCRYPYEYAGGHIKVF